jgi:NAD(P)-dependent dehydrogenase (short-subunit alcohol dehydrogenase family)
MASSTWNQNNLTDQTGKVIVITGSTSGLGKEAARQLAGKGATVVMAVRNTQKAEGVKKEILSQHPGSDIRIEQLDLGDLASVKGFSDRITAEYDHLDILINNAGVMMCPFSKTKDGFEIQMGTNHLGPFALTGQLMPLLKKTPNSRVVVTSSIAHRQGDIDFSDLNWEKRSYKTMKAYGDSKLANLYFTYELAERLKGQANAPEVTAAHPGWTKTELQRHSGLAKFLNNFMAQKVEIGTLPTIRAAVDPDANSGDYYGPSGFQEMWGNPKKVKSSPLSHDREKAKQLWEMSEKLTQVSYF